MRNSVTHPSTNTSAVLYGACGRKYLNRSELHRFLDAAAHARLTERLLSETLAMTGARISELLAVTPARCQVKEATIALVTLKRRCLSIREVPLPRKLMKELDACFDIQSAQLDPKRAHRPLWRMHRVSAWRLIKRLMNIASIIGSAASPRGLRHGFGVNTLQSGVPISLVQRWMGHARMSTTAIYLEVSGPEERMFATRFWKWGNVEQREGVGE